MKFPSICTFAFVALAAATAEADPARLVLDPAATEIDFHLGATLHSVDGSASLLAGEIRFDTGGGPASGRISIDARSAETGSSRRDAGLHADVLESERFPEIAFVPESLEILSRGQREAEIRLLGEIEIHGETHPLTVPAQLTADGDRIHVQARFDIPYVAWGMRDPSVLVLRVAKQVQVTIRAEGHLE